MRNFVVLVACIFGVLLTVEANATLPERTLAGWYNVVPTCQCVNRMERPVWYLKPIVSNGTGEDRKYSQTAVYDLATGLPRSFHLILARDPAFADQHSPEALKKIANELPLPSKRSCWVVKKARKVIIPLKDCAAIILEVPDDSWQPMPLEDFAAKFDLERVETALSKPPRMTFDLDADAFRKIKPGDSWHAVTEWVGYAAIREDLGKRSRWTYTLKTDGKIVLEMSPEGVTSLTQFKIDGAIIDLFGDTKEK